MPLSKFKTERCENRKGYWGQVGCDSSKAAGEFIHVIADAIREKLAFIMCSVNAFSVLSDGSQAKKTNAEKELVLIRIVKGVFPFITVWHSRTWNHMVMQMLKT